MPDTRHYPDSTRACKNDHLGTEIWRPVPGEPGVLASSWGRVLLPPSYRPMPKGGFSLIQPVPRFGQESRAKKDAAHSYKIVMLRSEGGTSRQRPRKVHQLVCEAFHGPRPFDGAVVIHINEDAHDNRPENLKWGTQKENLNAPSFKEYCRSGPAGARTHPRGAR